MFTIIFNAVERLQVKFAASYYWYYVQATFTLAKQLKIIHGQWALSEWQPLFASKHVGMSSDMRKYGATTNGSEESHMMRCIYTLVKFIYKHQSSFQNVLF